MEEKMSTNGVEVKLDNLIVSSSPHLRSNETVQKTMLDVIIALVPAMIASVYFFGIRSAVVIATSVIFAVLSEWAFEKFMHRPVTISDLSAVVTGILLAFNVPANIPLYMIAFGAIFAIVIAKQIYGGLGQNFVNPALAARAVMMVSWTKEMANNFIMPGADAVATSTPLQTGKMLSVMDMFIGKMPGCLGEVSAAALILGGIYLIARKVISWRIPVIYIATTAILLIVFGKADVVVPQLFAGGLMLGAFFMATDYTTSPISAKGQIIFAFGCGLMTVLIRVYGGYPEGVSYSILLMNICAPMIERFTQPKVFGVEKKRGAK